MKKIDIKLKILFLIFVFGILSFISYDLNKYEAFYIPDFTVNIFFSKLVAEEHTLKYCNEYAVKYNAPVFGGRYFVRAKDDGCVTHAYFHGYIIILAIFRMINESLIYFVTPLLAVIALIFFYKISRLFFDTILLFQIIADQCHQILYIVPDFLIDRHMGEIPCCPVFHTIDNWLF